MEVALIPTDAPETENVVVLLGNDNPHMKVALYDPDTGEHVGFQSIPAKHLKQSVTRIEMQPDFADEEHVERALSTDNDRQLWMIGRLLPPEHRLYAIGIQHIEHTMNDHAGGLKPSWVDCTDEGFAKAIAAYYDIPLGQPQAVLTLVGRDAVHNQHLTTGTQPAAFNYLALTASTTAPSSSDTTLTGEIATGGGGLVRAQGSFAHTSGTNTSTVTKTFTANGSDALPVTVAQVGVFNASSVGTLGYHTALGSTATLNVSGDNITVTETVTAG